MPFNPDIHHRQSLRYSGHDYSLPGAYFITACTHNREPLFGQIASGQMCLNDAGLMVQTIWNELSNRFANIVLDEFVVMPDHVHGIVILTSIGLTNNWANTRFAPTCNAKKPNGRGESCIRPESYIHPNGTTPGSIGNIVQAFKSLTTKHYIDAAKRGKWPCFDMRLWQRNYWDHIIRDDAELLAIREYIRNNPAQWQK